LASAGYVRADAQEQAQREVGRPESAVLANAMSAAVVDAAVNAPANVGSFQTLETDEPRATREPITQTRIEFAPLVIEADEALETGVQSQLNTGTTGVRGPRPGSPAGVLDPPATSAEREQLLGTVEDLSVRPAAASGSVSANIALPPLNSAEKFTREVSVESLTNDIRPLGQLDESFIIAVDNDGLLLIDQHVAHERILFDKYRALESTRSAESQHLLIPETFDLTPAQASVFDVLAEELESYGFELMRLSGRTVAIKAAPADLPAGEARNMLAELLDTVDAEKKGSARETLRDDIAASLACHAAIKVNMSLTPEKMRWLIDRLLKTSSPTTCPHGRPVILRLATRDILKGFHRI
jgi:DNA mismatch repair ATPase MutL